ncbi:MAG: hypothetical protein HYZ93_05540 [Candidatus Omnitrophica bacterium]|nr:hypothetical protein [Candidatus Omnitrophota bacterium]
MGSHTATLEPLMKWLTDHGFSGLDLETQEGLLILRLDPAGRSRLLADALLRRQLVEEARRLGFPRLALELEKAA